MRSEPDEGAAINFDAETWPLGYADNAPIVLDRIRQHGLPDGMLGAVELEHWLDRRKGGRSVGRQDGKELQRSCQSDARSPNMRIVPRAESDSHIGDLFTLG